MASQATGTFTSPSLKIPLCCWPPGTLLSQIKYQQPHTHNLHCQNSACVCLIKASNSIAAKVLYPALKWYYAALLSFLRLSDSVLPLHHSPCNSVGLSNGSCPWFIHPAPMSHQFQPCTIHWHHPIVTLCPHSTLCVTNPDPCQTLSSNLPLHYPTCPNVDLLHQSCSCVTHPAPISSLSSVLPLHHTSCHSVDLFNQSGSLYYILCSSVDL